MLGLVLACVLPTTWIVDANSGPGTHFTDLPAAVAAAQSGDTILVRPGIYTAFSVSGKALTIRGAGQNTTVIDLPTGHATHSHLTIEATPSGETFFLSGLSILAHWLGPSVGALNALAGAKVVLADCLVSGDFGITDGRAGLNTTGSEVHAHRCSFWGGPNGAVSTIGPNGARIEAGSEFSADSCEFIGASGVYGLWRVGASGLFVSASAATVTRCNGAGGHVIHHAPLLMIGGHGAEVASGSLRIAGTANNSFVGGSGGSTGPSGFALYAAGGTITVHGPVTLTPGIPNPQPTSGPVQLGGPLLPYLDVSGTLLQSRELNAALPVTVDLDGLFPNTLYFFLVSTAPDYFTTAPWGLGEVLLFLPAATSQVGLLDATGHKTFTFTPASVPGMLNLPFYSQAAVFDAATGQLRLSQSNLRLFAL
ncbi:MAG TPA: hypothetical protein VF384_05920 [Planctomycetota bacterium]